MPKLRNVTCRHDCRVKPGNDGQGGATRGFFTRSFAGMTEGTACPDRTDRDQLPITPPSFLLITTTAGRGGRLGEKSGQRVEGLS